MFVCHATEGGEAADRHKRTVLSSPRPVSGHFDPLPSRVLQLAADGVRRETTYAFDLPMLESLIAFVVQTLKPLNFAEETVVRAKGAKEILDALGLNFLADSVESNWGPVPGQIQMRIATVSPAMRKYVDEQAAGETIASAVGVVGRITLRSIAAHLVRLSSERADIVMRHDVKISVQRCRPIAPWLN